ncbi:universal stress protein [Marinomonas pollencensis]|uniref:Universal stress protein n=1 Tax=Marinomonas pollencensis TaxID=491954 RepID=A0A3E0DT44_9GAMM|nr:universal stress protein [Marinomonas pollencensis]REG85666.1 universal stress protein A [Marinomonas pollencensis]
MYQKILVAIDLTQASQQLLKKAYQLAKIHQAELQVIHVDQSFLGTYDGILDINETDFEERLQHESIRKMRTLFDNSQFVVDKYYVTAGNIDDEILQIIKRENIDLVVLGHHKSSLLRQTFMSISEPIIRHMPCDVNLLRT